jgi:Cof subfamily protein (haloacid dehalogenase superfamily)
MGKFDGILICTDLDGTLLRNDKTISQENSDAIEYFKREGGYFTFVTGRMHFTARSLYEMVKSNAPVGCINGGGIYDYKNEKYLWSITLPEAVKELVGAVYDAVPSAGIQMNALDTIYFCRDNDAMRNFRKRTGAPNTAGDYRTLDVPVAKVVFGDEDADNILRIAEILHNHPRSAEFDYIRSERTLYEILPKGSSKGNLLPRLANILGVDMSHTIAVGDYNNDVSMIQAAGVGIAVANAVDEVKAVADLVTVSNEEHAIAKIIGMIDSGEIEFSC